MHLRPSPVYETADPPGGGDRNSFSADYVARLQADLDKARGKRSAGPTLR